MSYSCVQMNADQSNLNRSPLLIRLPNWVGDVCMSVPALKRIQALGIPIAICARPWAKDLLAGLGIEHFIPINGKFLSDLRTLKAWHRTHPEFKQALLLPDSLSSALLFRMVGLRCTGYKDDGRSLLLSYGVNKPQTRLHAVRAWFNLTEQALEKWGYTDHPQAIQAHIDIAAQIEIAARLGLPLTAEHITCAQQSLKLADLVRGDFVLIAPTAVGQHKGQVKVWPHFDALTRQLQATGRKVVMCPPPAEQAAATLAAPSALLLPPLSLGAFAALAQHARLVICNDSGASHVSAAAGARQLTLFGVTDPEITGPWTPDTVNLGQNGQWPALDDVLSSAQQILFTH